MCAVQAIEQGGANVSYSDLLHSMHRALKSLNQKGSRPAQPNMAGLLTGFVGRLVQGQSLQQSILDTAVGTFQGKTPNCRLMCSR